MFWFSQFEMWTPCFGSRHKLEFQVANNELYTYNMISGLLKKFQSHVIMMGGPVKPGTNRSPLSWYVCISEV